MDRVPGYEPVGRKFESCQARQAKQPEAIAVSGCFFVLFSGISSMMYGKKAKFAWTNDDLGDWYNSAQKCPVSNGADYIMLA